MVSEYNSSVTIPQLLFLGLDERKNSGFEWTIYNGSPYFALDVTPKGTIRSAAETLIESMKSRGLQFVEGRMHMSLPAEQAAIYAQARALLDWNARNPFCAQCGQPTLSINAGTKRTCPPKDMASLTNIASIGSTTAATPAADRPNCATRKGISNLCFPRTDPVCTFQSRVLSIYTTCRAARHMLEVAALFDFPRLFQDSIFLSRRRYADYQCLHRLS